MLGTVIIQAVNLIRVVALFLTGAYMPSFFDSSHTLVWQSVVILVALLVWIAVRAGGLGTLLSQPSQLGWGSEFWKVFFPALMGMIGFWSTLSLNIPDFTRFGGSQRAQIRGQALGLPTTMTLFALLSVLVSLAGGFRVAWRAASGEKPR